MKGRKGWNSRSACESTQSITASVLARRRAVSETAGGVATGWDEGPAASIARPGGFDRIALLASTYQSQYSLQKKRYSVCVASLKRYSAKAALISRIAPSSLS